MEYGFGKELYKSQEQFIKDATETISNRGIGIFSSPTGTGKTLSLLCTAINQIQRNRNSHSIYDDDNLFDLLSTGNPHTIYYCSRTHSQLNQAINELKKNKNAIKSLILGSRKVYCINDEVLRAAYGNTAANQSAGSALSLKSHTIPSNNKHSEAPRANNDVEKLNKACKNAIKDESCKYYTGQEEYSGKGIMDIEELKLEGSSCGWCPYYYSKLKADECEIVFLPYNLIFNREARKAMGIDLEDKVVIIDEAHNLYEAITQLNSAEVLWEDIAMIGKIKGFSDDLNEIIRRLLALRDRIKEEEICGVVDFLNRSKLANYNMLKIDEFILANNFAQKNDLNVIFEFSRFLKLLTFSDKGSRVIFSRHKLKFTTMDPSMYFYDLRSCKSILLAGGTMEPIAPLQRVFASLKYYSYPPITDNFLPIILSETASKKKIHLVYTERENQIDDIANTLVALASPITHGGVIIFVTSKYILNLIRSSPKSKNFRRKVCFEDDIELQEFRANPCILVAVLGGKLSEGINFEDEMCRLLVILGVPYPKKSIEMDERTKYDPEWGVNIAMSMANQALGRAIRHKGDYAALVLMDERYLGLRRKITPWINQKIKSPSFVEGLRMIKDFLTLNAA